MLRNYTDDASPIICVVEIEGYDESFSCRLLMSIEKYPQSSTGWKTSQVKSGHLKCSSSVVLEK